MTYYVQKNVFTPGDVADADNLMIEFYRAASAMSSIDQNNIAPLSINHSVAIPPKPTDSSDMQRGPFVCYDEGSPSVNNILYATGGAMSTSSLTNLKFSDYKDPGFDLRFTTRVAATYHFFLQATAVRDAARPPLTIDSIIRLNGSQAGGTQVTCSSNCLSAGNDKVPIAIRTTQFLEPGVWHATPSFRPRAQDPTHMPSITNISMGVIGFIR
jgi:hypothetical protein